MGLTEAEILNGGLDAAWLEKIAAEGGASAAKHIRAVGEALNKPLESAEVAETLDKRFGDLSSGKLRSCFNVPKHKDLPGVDTKQVDPEADCTYLVGNSLGLQPKRTRELVNEELDSWSKLGVNGHFMGKRPWMPIDENVIEQSAKVVGAKPSEVAVMNSLTLNLHLLFVSFYRPKGKRVKIMYESCAFGSDYFAFHSQAQLHGLDPKEVLMPIEPRSGEELLRTEDVIAAIEAAGDTLAVLCFGTVQYYTGQLFDVEAITKAAQKVGSAALWDCAHAAGNIDLKLHDWGVDGACWCSYKYLNSGPGGIAGFFVHEKHHGKGLPVLAGWWGQKQATRFNMAHNYDPESDAGAWRLSNPPVLQTVSLLGSLEVYARTTMSELRGRSILLTGYLELLLPASEYLSVITPKDPKARGCQLSLKFTEERYCVETFKSLEAKGVVCDHRKPNVIRIAPAPLYNTFSDVHKFCTLLKKALDEVSGEPATKKAKA
eukprot:TRINITY_DN10715_c3_g1_i1.p1 TRINITY_DN10715_c3_g1~~TRINITY_DN10715_c3_g1_i1.p1  ORF type:complete len:488 (-),score=107.25 TRINITY_DN10715_c3_g1_i1:162-1625(-)